MVVKVVDRASGAELDVVQAGGVVELSGASDVHLGLNVGSVESLVRIGDDLVVTSSGGGTTVLGGFFGGVGSGQGSRIFVDGSNEVTGTERRGDDMIVRLENGDMLVIENYYNQDTNTGEAPVADEAVLLPDGSEAVPPWLLLAGGVAGVSAVAVAASGGGSSGGGDDTPPPLPNITRVTPSEITGTAEPGSTIEVDVNGDGVADFTATADPVTGEFRVVIDPALQDGDMPTVRARDAAGNVSEEVPVTVDVFDQVVINPSNGTEITGTAEPGAMILIDVDNGDQIITMADPVTGEFRVSLNGDALPGGTQLTATASDAAGNVSVSETVTVDDTPPMAPTVNPTNGSVITGTAEIGSTVEVDTDGDGEPNFMATADQNGVYRIDTGGPLANDLQLSVTATDPSGNTSAPTIITVDAAAPTMTISGNGGVDGDGLNPGLITFNFSEQIDASSFTVEDINVENGEIVAGSFAQDTTNPTVFTMRVDSDFGPGTPHTNVAVSVAQNSFTDLAGNAGDPDAVARNETTLDGLFASSSPLAAPPQGILPGWDTSQVTSAQGTFSSNSTFNEDISGWETSKITSMFGMFIQASVFNQDISGWDVSSVANMSSMFTGATAFDQDLGAWDISNVITMDGMFFGAAGTTSMSAANMDSTLRGWAKLDRTTGEEAIQSNVELDAFTFTDATAAQYLDDMYQWDITGLNRVSSTFTILGDNLDDDTLTVGDTDPTIVHGLGGDDTITGDDRDNFLVGGAGDDTLEGGLGSDTFDYGFENAGDDTITDFTTGVGGDIIDISDLLIGFGMADSDTSDDIADFVTAEDDGAGNTILTIDHDGTGSLSQEVTITLENVVHSDALLDTLIQNDNLIVM